ncbi:hypothetical protein [Streptomyces silaceus]|uniref:hypothetical protein n=1 Tax=Streptomyces silaceus TaxID=545123 RepID=UPI0006EBB7B4|nr:hypothetical protein [Streptomyces silaceus]
MSAREQAERLTALVNEIEQAGFEVRTNGSSIVVGDVKVVMGAREGDPWIVRLAPPRHPRERVLVTRPDRYLRSSTGLLHLRSEYGVVEDDGMSNHQSVCGVYFDLKGEAIPLKVGEGDRICKRCLSGAA